MVMKNVLPRRLAVGLRDVQTEEAQLLAKQTSYSVYGPHYSLGFVFRKCPDIFGVTSRNHKRVASGNLSLIEKGYSALVLEYSPRWQRPIEELTEGTIHQTMIPASFSVGQCLSSVRRIARSA
jgi:hypothetical protein